MNFIFKSAQQFGTSIKENQLTLQRNSTSHPPIMVSRKKLLNFWRVLVFFPGFAAHTWYRCYFFAIVSTDNPKPGESQHYNYGITVILLETLQDRSRNSRDNLGEFRLQPPPCRWNRVKWAQPSGKLRTAIKVRRNWSSRGFSFSRFDDLSNNDFLFVFWGKRKKYCFVNQSAKKWVTDAFDYEKRKNEKKFFPDILILILRLVFMHAKRKYSPP